MAPFEDSETNILNSDHILDWLQDTVTFLPSFLDDPYNVEDQWWDPQHHQEDPEEQDLSFNVSSDITSAGLVDPLPVSSDASKKRKQPSTPSSKSPSDGVVEQEVVKAKRTVSSKKSAPKGNTGTNKEGRWADQLLNPCAIAIGTGNLTRVQHLLYVLHELASVTGDANHRLAAHGLRALTHHLSSSTAVTFSSASPNTFSSTEARLFQRSLLKFGEISPWFTFPNTIANASILQILAQDQDSLRNRNLHIVDIGVSHGLQWPTLLEALSNRTGGPPPIVRLTIVAPASVQNGGPFSVGPASDDTPSRLLRFAKSINLNLQINLINNKPLQTLTPQALNISPDEILIFSAQFRLHSLSHTSPDDRTDFLKLLRSFEPKAVILSDNNMDCSCSHCGDFKMGFSQRVEYLWRFLDSTSSAFKGRECEERKVMEGEAAISLMNGLDMNEGKEKWCEKMRGVGFVSEIFGEDAIDGARALLRKYDSNWEMRIDGRDGCVCLWWKGQPISFCSLWTLEKSGVTAKDR